MLLFLFMNTAIVYMICGWIQIVSGMHLIIAMYAKPWPSATRHLILLNIVYGIIKCCNSLIVTI
jgi:uncharacterized membrane protein HdeD (DUF308 family)